MPFRRFLDRIRQIVPHSHDDHYEAIARDFESGALRQPVKPMSDGELAAAIAEFVKTKPSAASRDALNANFNPASGGAKDRSGA